MEVRDDKKKSKPIALADGRSGIRGYCERGLESSSGGAEVDVPFSWFLSQRRQCDLW